jgi:hypothetical protein
MTSVEPAPSHQIGVKQAAEIAAKFVMEVLNEEIIGAPRLEEVELTDDRKWLITVSFLRRKVRETSSSIFEAVSSLTATPIYEREYKRVVISADTGNVEAMRIRDV